MPQWIRACATDAIGSEYLIHFDRAGSTFAIYHLADGKFYAAAGRCTHENAHLSDGLAMDHLFECPRHYGQFDHRTGEASCAPVCVNLGTYLTKIAGGAVFVKVE